MSFVNPENSQAREHYKNVLEKIKTDSVCPFCKEQLAKYHTNPILKENATWLITKNMYPYKNTKEHFLLIHKEHISSVTEMTEAEQKDLHELINWATHEFKLLGATFFMRYGDTRYTGATVGHLHGQLVASDPFRDGYEPVLTRIG